MRRFAFISLLMIAVLPGCSSFIPRDSANEGAVLSTTATNLGSPSLVPTGSVEGSLHPDAEEGEPEHDVNPLVEISVSPTSVRAGDQLTVVVKPTDIDNPYYKLLVDGAALLELTYSGEVIGVDLDVESPAVLVLDVVSFSATRGEAQFILEAVQAGTVTVVVSVSGQVHHVGFAGPATWEVHSSRTIEVSVGDL